MSRIIKVCKKAVKGTNGNIENITTCFATFYNSDAKFIFLL